MRLEFTVDDGDASVDVAVSAPDATSIAAVRARLADLGLVRESTTLWCNGQALTSHATLADCLVRTGSTIKAGARDGVASAPELLSLDVIGGPAAGQQIGLRTGRVSIGRDPTCDLHLDDPDVSREHATIEVSRNGLSLIDNGSTNGTSVEGIQVRGSTRLHADQVVRIGDSFLVVTRAADAPAVTRNEGSSVCVSRPPRAAPHVPDLTIDLPQPDRDPATRRMPIVAALLPSVAGVVFAVAMHTPQFLFFALASPLALLATSFGDRLHWRRDRRRSQRVFAAQRDAVEDEIARTIAVEQRVRRLLAPSPTQVERTACLPSIRLWERRSIETDFLTVRLGLCDAPTTTAVRDGPSTRPAGTAHAVPITVDLRGGPLGIAGPREAVRASGHWIVMQLCTMHSPNVIEIAFFLDNGGEFDWSWARWLPHFRGRAATTPERRAELLADLGEVINQRATAIGAMSSSWTGPWLVVIVDADLARTESTQLAVLLAGSTRIGITAVWLSASPAALPAFCVAQAIIDSVTGNRVRLVGSGMPVTDAVLDRVTLTWADRVARAMAPLSDAADEISAGIPDSCTLWDVLEDDDLTPEAITRRWRSADDGCATTVGACADGPFTLDFVRDGPHALVAGTTGSGKSELLQAIVLGLAATYPPEQLSFVLIDYKGGAAFSACARLPHTAGLVTDLDPHLTRRALQALDAEVRRREHLFARAGATDIGEYRSRPAGEALPRLMLLVDEFATLADELPDFLHGLVSIARRGRSLGIHLVLATQRPGAAVSQEIRANANMRICLRVTGAAESIEVLNAADAVLIDRRTPGRAILRAGDSLTHFQTAGVGLPMPRRDERIVAELLGSWRSSPTRVVAEGDRVITAMCASIQQATAESGRRAAAPPWCAPLPAMLASRDLPEAPATLVPVGLIDLPQTQRQDPLHVDLLKGAGFLFTGGSRSGRSTALCSMAIRAAQQRHQEHLHIYAIDQRGGLAGLRRLPHCATYLSGGAMSSTATLLQRLAAEGSRRRQWLAERSFASVSEAAGQGFPLPSVLLLVDDWEDFAAAADDRDGGQLIDLLLALARGSAGIAMTTVAAGGRTTLNSRVATAFTRRFLFAMNDSADYAVAGLPPRARPTAMPRGRALRVEDGAEVQFSFVGASPNRADQDAEIAALQRRDGATAEDAIQIRPLPTCVVLKDLPRQPNRVTLGVGGETAAAVHLDLTSVGTRMLIVGPPRSGRTTTLRTLLAQLDADAVVVAAEDSELVTEARHRGIAAPTGHELASLTNPPGSIVLIDDLELFEDGAATETILAWLRDPTRPIVATGHTDEVAASYRGISYQLRRERRGLLLQPAAVDGDVFGLRLPRHRETSPPGRGILVGMSGASVHEPLGVQVARP